VAFDFECASAQRGAAVHPNGGAVHVVRHAGDLKSTMLNGAITLRSGIRGSGRATTVNGSVSAVLASEIGVPVQIGQR
jgi:hypothetical protein